MIINAQISLAVTAKLITSFVFATRIVPFLYFLNLNLEENFKFPLLSKKIFQPLAIFCACTAWFVADLFGNNIVGFLMTRLIFLSNVCFMLISFTFLSVLMFECVLVSIRD